MPGMKRRAEDALERLAAGFDHFHNVYFETNHSLYDELVCRLPRCRRKRESQRLVDGAQ
jgi:hypothetical protein